MRGQIREPQPRLGHRYCVAFVKADGTFDRVDRFRAASDAEANAYAEERYADREWFVLDAGGRNINGGRDQ
jgi:hypothetical protein